MNHITRSPAHDGNHLRTLSQIFAASAARFIRDVRSGRAQVSKADTAFVVAGGKFLF
jgi:hypothetical protein